MLQNSANEDVAFETITRDLIDWIKSEPLIDRPEVAIDDDTELLSSGLIDSLDMMRLVAFIEERYGVQLPEEQLVSSHFRSVRTLTDLVMIHVDLAESVAG